MQIKYANNNVFTLIQGNLIVMHQRRRGIYDLFGCYSTNQLFIWKLHPDSLLVVHRFQWRDFSWHWKMSKRIVIILAFQWKIPARKDDQSTITIRETDNLGILGTVSPSLSVVTGSWSHTNTLVISLAIVMAISFRFEMKFIPVWAQRQGRKIRKNTVWHIM